MGRSVTTQQENSTASSVLIQAEDNVNQDRYLAFVDSVDGFNTFKVNPNIKFNTATGELFVSTITADTIDANSINAAVTGSSAAADSLSTPRKISLGGDLSGFAYFDGTSDISIDTVVKINSVALGDDTTGDYVRSIFTTNPYVTLGGNSGESADITISLNASTTATPNTLVARDSSSSSKFNVVEANSIITNSIVSADTIVIKSSSSPAVKFVDQNNVSLFSIDNSGNAYIKNDITSNNLNVGNITIENVLKLDTTSSIGALIGEEHTIDSFPINQFRTAKYIVQVSNGNKYQSSELLLLHDGFNAYVSEYAFIETMGILCTFDAIIVGGMVKLVAYANFNNLSFKVVRYNIAI